ncbi:MAG: beta-propeller fold lactonase family protein [Planctomycetaceae bacterium]
MSTTMEHGRELSGYYGVMIHRLVFCVVNVLLLAIPSGLKHCQASGEEAFQLVVPDAANQQVVAFHIRTESERVQIERGDAVRVPFAPHSISWNKRLGQLITTSGSEQESWAATIVWQRDNTLKLAVVTELQHPSGYTSVDQSGRFFMTAHYASGTIAVYSIQDDGTISRHGHSVVTPNAEAHCILTTRDNRFAYVPCVKLNNALFQYAFDASSGTLQPLTPFNANPPAMFGPRHIAYHPTLPVCYFSNEQQLGVSVYRIGENGQLADLQHAVTMPRRTPFENGKRDLHASDLAVTSDGERLFVAVRDFNGSEDSLFSFRIESDGRLSLLARTLVGDIPWRILLSPDDNFLLVSETGSAQLSVYKIASTGELTLAAKNDWGISPRDMVIAAGK